MKLIMLDKNGKLVTRHNVTREIYKNNNINNSIFYKKLIDKIIDEY